MPSASTPGVLTSMKVLLGGLVLGGVLAACTTSHVDNPTVVTPPSISPTSTAGVAQTPTPCSVLTRAQVTTAFGGAVADGVAAVGGLPNCQWSVTHSNVGTDGDVNVYYPSLQTSAAFHAAEAALPGAQKVVELGDAAFYDPKTNALTVLVGQHQFVVQGTFTGSPDAAALQVDLIAVARDIETHF